MDRLQKALCAIELDKAEPAGRCPNDVVASDFWNLRILSTRNQDDVHEEEKDGNGHKVDCDDDSSAVEMDAAHGFFILSKGPGNKGFYGAEQTHWNCEDQDVQEHVTETDASQFGATYLPDV